MTRTLRKAASRALYVSALLSFLICEFSLHAGQISPERPSLPILTHVTQVRELTPEKARLGYPVRLRAVVTYFHPEQGDMFIQDATAGIYVNPTGVKAPLHPGQLVEVEGISGPGDFASEVIKPRVRILGRAPMPVPQKVSGEELASGRQDSQWIEVEGVVRSAAEHGGRLMVDIASGGIQFKAFVLNYRPIPPDLVDAKVRLRGVSGGIYNPKNQFLGVAVFVPSLSDVRVIKPALISLFSLPVRPIHILLRLTPQGAFSHRIRVRGVVSLQRLGRSLFIRDEEEGLLVKTNQMTPVNVGDRVDAVGFPAVGEYTPVLEDAIFRKIGGMAKPERIAVTAEQALQGRYDAELVRVQARLVDRAMRPTAETLVLEEGNSTFEAELEHGAGEQALSSLRNGSLLQLTGICSVQVDENREPRSFRILLRSPEDIILLEPAPWWTLKHLLLALGVMGALILGALVWAGVLRSEVGKQTLNLRESLHREAGLKERYREIFENATDIIYTHDLAGKYTSLNKAGEKISGYTRDELLKMDISQIVVPEYVDLARQMTERKLAGGGATTYEVEIIARDGRRIPLEVSTRLIYEDEKPAGVQGIARDITERKQAEESLRKSEERFRLVSRATNDVVWDWNLLTNAIWCNEATKAVLGYPREVVGPDVTWWTERIHPEDRERVNSGLHAVLDGDGEYWSDEYRFCHADGSYRYFFDRGYVLRANEGNPVRMIGAMVDISDRKQAEEALRQLPRRLLQFQDEERRRIARELHDATAQSLAALVMNLGAVKKSVDKLSPKARDAFSESLALAKQASREVRTLSYLLHPPMLDEFGLVPALRGYVEGFGRRSGIHVHLDMSPHIDRLSQEFEITVFRIVQESLTNIYQHSGSKSAQIRIALNANAIKVEVKDDGRGMAIRTLKAIEKGSAAPLGVGIAGMRERVKQLGGELTIQSDKGGTSVAAVLPLHKTN